VLVTGATGFIGSHLAKVLLDRGQCVTCLVRRSSPPDRIDELKRLGARILEAELANIGQIDQALKCCEVVYHVAGATRARSRIEFFHVNSYGTYHFLSALAMRQTPPVVVLVSSLAAAGPTARREPRCELHAPAPISWYGRSKLAGELLSRSLADRLPISIVRPPMVLGPGDTTSVELFRMLLRVPLHLMPGFRARQYSLVFADELVQALLVVADRGERLPAEPARLSRHWNQVLAGNGTPHVPSRNDLKLACRTCSNGGEGVYYLARSESITYAQLGNFVAQAAGRRWIVCMPVPKSAIWCMATYNELVARARGCVTFFGWDKWREATTGDWTCSPAKAKQQLDFRTDGDLAEKFRCTFEWYRERRWL
jgi:nucleoside-diphosphate-sugar epimerase